MKYNGNKKVLIEDFMEDVAVSFLFFRNPFVFVILWLVVAAGIGAIVMLLWNWLMPVIFGLPALSLWQALGLLVLMRILFGSFGFGRRGGRLGGGMPGMPGRGMNPVREKWMKMTPETTQGVY